jgi:hypothetical protein
MKTDSKALRLLERGLLLLGLLLLVTFAFARLHYVPRRDGEIRSKST